MKKILFILAVLFVGLGNMFAQKTLNNYAYVVVPYQFGFQSSENQYKLNSLTKFLFEKQGMKVFWDTEKIPKEYIMLDCAGLRLKMNKKSSMFRIKVQFELLDCYNNNVFTSELGSSTEKEYKKGYHESIRNAFESFAAMDYTYVAQQPAVEEATVVAVAAPQKAPDVSATLVYANDSNLVVELTVSGGSYIGKVKSSESIEYVTGDVLCKLFKTSLPNVFKAQWKDADGNFINTIAYFDEQQDLYIDFSAPTGITVMKFSKQ